jgi:hypothetical protein
MAIRQLGDYLPRDFQILEGPLRIETKRTKDVAT